MPAQVSELKVRNVAIRLHHAGRGPTVLFLHGAGGVPQWLPFFDALMGVMKALSAPPSRLLRPPNVCEINPWLC